MADNPSILETVLENLSRGLIYIDEDAQVRHYSSLAKRITGITLSPDKVHPAGRINEGDIVIIADNELGNDDALDIRDLTCLNIHEKQMKPGDALLAIGIYRNVKIKPIYKYATNYSPNGILSLRETYMGFSITAQIDFSNRELKISVNEESYVMNYIQAVGHMVIIDGITGKVKFFQARGYGPRAEEIGKILRGKTYTAKPGDETGDKLIPETGLPLDALHWEEDFTTLIRELLTTQSTSTRSGLYDIHKRPLYCVLIRIKNQRPNDGVYLTIQDSRRMENQLEEERQILDLLQQQLKYSLDPTDQSPADIRFGDFVGNDPAMREVKLLASRAAKAKFNVIITGESGTGKSQLAREIHRMSGNPGPFVEVNCNAITPSLFESELFGYVAGAFTGASSGGKAGFFEAADGGTLFLDEIGDIPLEIQVKLLHVLQNKKIYRVGSSTPINVNVRVITATNSDLEAAIAAGRFRQDLYYRINVFPICIPPLRHHRGDIYVLVNHIMKDLSHKYGVGYKQLSEEALDKIHAYDWPGNVRELENVLERAVTLCDGPIIYSEYISIREAACPPKTLKAQLDAAEKKILIDALNKHHQNRKAAMAELDVSKSVFYEKLKKHGLTS